MQVALAKGKKLYDKRQDIAKKTSGGKPNGISKCGILDRCFAKKAGGKSYIFAPRGKRSAVKLSLRKILIARQYFLLRKKTFARASNGFDRDHAAGEASRTGYVKFHN